MRQRGAEFRYRRWIGGVLVGGLLFFLVSWAATPVDPGTRGPVESNREATVPALLEMALEVLNARFSGTAVTEDAIDEEIGVVLASEAGALGLYDADLTGALRDEVGGGPIFVDAGGLTPAGRALADTVTELDRHGLQPGVFQADAIRYELDHLEPRRSAGFILTEDARIQLTAALEGERELIDPVEIARLLSTPGTNLFDPVLLDIATRMELDREARLRVLARLELRLMDAFVRYALEMEVARDADRAEDLPWGIPDRAPSRPPVDLIVGDFEEALTTQLQVVRLMTLLTEVSEDKDRYDDVHRALAGMAPLHPDYLRLKAAYARYVTIAHEGGWDRLILPVTDDVDGVSGEPATRAFVEGETSDLVVALRRRLRIEGFMSTPAEGPYDADVRAALAKARRSYGIEGGGSPLDAPLSSRLDVSAEQRRDQIALNLQRWRRVRLQRDMTYVHINVPGGSGVFVRNGAPHLSFEVQPTIPDGLRVRADDPVFSRHLTTIDASGGLAFNTRGEAAPSLFGRAEGARRCAGCYLIPDGAELASRLLAATGVGHIDAVTLEDRRSGQLALNPYLPIHVTYLTATTDTNGDVRFLDDVHGRDRIRSSTRWPLLADAGAF